MLEPIKKLKINYEFYSIDSNFRPLFEFGSIDNDSVFVYTNYFGICDNLVNEISSKCKNLIIDNSQAFYSKPIPGVDTFYSARKFFGVPDGAYLYTNKVLGQDFESDISYQRFEHLLGRIDHGAEKFYDLFKKNDESLGNQPIKKMSKLTQSLLTSINYVKIASIRRQNFEYLHSNLSTKNLLTIQIQDNNVPLVYPYLTINGELIKAKLLNKKIYIAKYWPTIKEWTNSELELKLIEDLVCLPIDQRYSTNQMEQIIKIISHYGN
jgi:hypothetical protein